MIEYRAKEPFTQPNAQNQWYRLFHTVNDMPEKHWFRYHIFRINGTVYTEYSELFVEAYGQAIIWRALND